MYVNLQIRTERSDLEIVPKGSGTSREEIHISSQKGERIKKMERQSQSNNTSKTQETLQAIPIREKLQNRARIKIRLAGLCLLFLIISILFAYGFPSNMNTGYYNNQTHSLVGITLFVSFIFVVIGFGLFLGYYIENMFTSIFTVLFIVSFTVILSPLLQKLWLNIFLNGFNNGLSTSVASYALLFTSNSNSNVSVNYSNIKLSICCAISQLLLYVAVIGRMQIYKTILTSFIFIICWNVNYALCVSVLKTSPDSRFFDDYSISMVYLFGGCASLLVSVDVPSNLHLKRTSRQTKIYPRITSLLGIFFIWMSFCCTFSIIGTKETSATITDNFRTVFYPEGCFQIFFALSSSTVSTFAFSYLFQGKPSILDFLTGSISGAILFGSVASFTTNIAAPIAIGIFAAFVSTYYRAHIMKQINKKKVYDMLGLFGPFVLTALIGVIVLSPIVLRSFFNFSLISPPLHGQPITSSNETAFVLIYAGISVGIGLITGMIISTMVRCLSGGEIRFGDNLNFLQDMNIQQKDFDYVQLADLK